MFSLGGLGVLAAIDLDDKPRRVAGEIDDVIADRRLATKAVTGELFVV